MNAFEPKKYQSELLKSVETYFQLCQELGRADRAYGEAMEQLWGRGLPYTGLAGFPADMPYFCLRVPTGGGKTWLAAKTVSLINTSLLRSEYSTILWLTPSTAIRDQTLALFKHRESPLRAALQEAGPITVMALDDAKSLTRATLESSTTIIVCTRQAFQVDNTDLRKVYESSGALMHHFEHLTDAQWAGLEKDENGVVPRSLVNALRLRRPFVIVDEAHNSRTELSFETLARFNPSGIMELTATPDTEKVPSNVLHSVSAAELKTAHMIKLPIVLETNGDWQRCLALALDKRDQLQAAASAERREGLPYLRPIVLVQAQARSVMHETLHVDAVRKELLENHNVPADRIVVATGDERGLEDISREYSQGILDERCLITIVITQKALAEGWDCPFAYVLVSLAGTKSEKDVEQLLGRVLRQPGARQRQTPELNQSYAFVMSRDFGEAASNLRDRLVEGAGFERKAVEEFVRAATPEQAKLDLKRDIKFTYKPVAVPLTEPPALRDMPKTVRDKVEWDKESACLVFNHPISEEESELLIKSVALLEAKVAIREAAHWSRTEAVTIVRCPAESGEKLEVPAMALFAQGELQLFDDPELLETDFELSPYDASPTSDDISMLEGTDRTESGGVIDIRDDGKLSVGFMATLSRDIGWSYQPENWDEVRVAAWLCKNLPDNALTHQAKWAFVQNWLTDLMRQPKFDIARVNRQKFVVRVLLERRIRELRNKALEQTYQATLFGMSSREAVRVGGEFFFAFDPMGYAPFADYDDRFGVYDFQHHYYSRIGDFDSKEEFECACWLDRQASLGHIDFWVRNIARSSSSSFFLQKASGKFYPDFVCRLKNEVVLVVEYKGQDRWEAAKDDRDIGGLWAELSGGKCKFVMTTKRDWGRIEQLLPSPEGALLEDVPELAVVRLKAALLDHGLKAGAQGTVVFVYPGGAKFEVEFLRGDAEPAVVRLKKEDIVLVATYD